ncbi:MAG TPA: hypothetical protein VGO11_02740 [Chthoniobacteraceae bacterium]|jgi:hypothetical protein|nr:hypothetical protein [Chthoniobacteraceae bacterium]
MKPHRTPPRLLLLIGVLLAATQRSPAPVSLLPEATPKSKETGKAKSGLDPAAFAGKWQGTQVEQRTLKTPDGMMMKQTSSTIVTITVAPGGRSLSFTQGVTTENTVLLDGSQQHQMRPALAYGPFPAHLAGNGLAFTIERAPGGGSTPGVLTFGEGGTLLFKETIEHRFPSGNFLIGSARATLTRVR